MSVDWANRQRRTNRLIRLIAGHILAGKSVSARQLYGLCQLTWITQGGYDDTNISYIQSTKIPGLGHAFKQDYGSWALERIATDVGATTGSAELANLITSHTGFTNFYKAYRLSCFGWIEKHHEAIRSIFGAALNINNDSDRRTIAEAIGELPGIPRANTHGSLMGPERLLTPVVFSLDRQIQFPLINGNSGVKALLSALKVPKAPLGEQLEKLITLYGQGGIIDAADLDQIGQDLPDFLINPILGPAKQLLAVQPTEGNALPLKDDNDLVVLLEATVVTQRRLHNQLTNLLRTLLSKHTLLEGMRLTARYDVLVKNYNGGDLLIEVKSSIEPPSIRLAIGQLFDYWYRTKGDTSLVAAILTPEKPAQETIDLLNWLKIGILWSDEGQLCTATSWLEELCKA